MSSTVEDVFLDSPLTFRAAPMREERRILSAKLISFFFLFFT